MKIDFHVHTELSDDANAKVCDIIRTAEMKGLDGVVILDHNTMKWQNDPILEKTSLKVFRAGEYSTEDGHIIVIGATTPIEDLCAFKSGRFETACVIDQAKLQGATLIFAHPFRWRLKPPSDDLLSKMDAIEVYNSRNLMIRKNPEANQKALDAAIRLKLPTVSGSDAHFTSEIGDSYVEVDTKGEVFDICNLKHYRLTVYGSPSHPSKEVRSQWIKASRYKNVKRKFKLMVKLILETIEFAFRSKSFQSGMIHTYKGVGKSNDSI